MNTITNKKELTPSQLKREVKKIDKNAFYTPVEISNLGVILGASQFYIYRLIKRGQLEAIEEGGNVRPVYKILGSELIKFLERRYPFIK